MQNSSILAQRLKAFFPFETTPSQQVFFETFAQFLSGESQQSAFVLKGYAGTGKTTLIASIVQFFESIDKDVVLMAPTGRAAKVMSGYSGKDAATIHRSIYYPNVTDGQYAFTLMKNKWQHALFIIDEASMLSDSGSEAVGNGLLDDLLTFVYSADHCAVLFVGDTAQLPPVHSDLSPALDPEKLAVYFSAGVGITELTEVMRQATDSGILMNATGIRNLIKSEELSTFQFQISGFPDIVRLQDPYDIQDAFESAFNEREIDESIVIVRSNKRANAYNNQIRNRILMRDHEIATGDLLMVVKNNYYWLADDASKDFIANGDIVEVLEIFKEEELYGKKFARVKVKFLDYQQSDTFECLVMLDTLQSESPALTQAEFRDFASQVEEDYIEYSPSTRYKKMKENQYFNALQVKFSYAMTCHKAQGGQWSRVFVEQPYLPEGVSIPYYRWLYTAITRAKEKLYLLNFSDEYFSG
ncbi:AAA family ATPase [Flavobacterium sp.]|uniref:ATP-dependent DNA helicase n=1 Tax=Flavobacterium sp. TaxID=239 RepID=UPI00262308B8|nr:AAA family ATPase [Flavobacterium sp.]